MESPAPTPPSPPTPTTPPEQASQHRLNSFPCASCGYNLRGVPLGGNCPECGLPIVHLFVKSGSNGLAITSMVMGIISILASFLWGIPGMVCGIIAVVFARKARIAVQKGTAMPTSISIAKSGRVCGIIGITIGGVVALAIVGSLAYDYYSYYN